VTAQSCTEELINGRNLTVRIPGFGQFVMELTGVCNCSCTGNPVGSTIISMKLLYILIRYRTVIFAMVMVVLFVGSVIVIQDGMLIEIMVLILNAMYLFSIFRVGDTCECSSNNISSVGCP